MKTTNSEIEQAAPAAAKSTIKHHRLIYGVGPNQEMFPVGSGLLLGVGARRFLLTAAHVLDWNRQGDTDYVDLATYGQGKTVVLKGESFRTAVPEAKTRYEDRLDVGFLLLDTEAAAQIGNDRFLSPPDCDLDDIGRLPALYGALGYPTCLNDTVGPDSLSPTTPTPFNYTAVLHDAAKYNKLGVSQNTHLLLDVSQRKTRAAGGRKVKLPDLHGMSGGGLWRLTQYVPGAKVGTPRLLGVLIEWHRGQGGGLLAARMGLVFEALRRVYLELDSLLPRTALADVSVEVVPRQRPNQT